MELLILAELLVAAALALVFWAALAVLLVRHLVGWARGSFRPQFHSASAASVRRRSTAPPAASL